MSAITEHSTLDVLLNDSVVFEHFDISFVYAARAELAQLRSAAAELEAARNEAGAIDGVPLADLIHEESEANDFCKANLEALQQQVTEQARRLDEAHHAISESSDALDGAGLGGCYASQACRAWLSATAPAPILRTTE